jgi:hypothetical protein
MNLSDDELAMLADLRARYPAGQRFQRLDVRVPRKTGGPSVLTALRAKGLIDYQHDLGFAVNPEGETP